MDNLSPALLYGLLTACILFSAFFSGAETGIMTANRYRLRHQARMGDKSAQRVLRLLAQPDRLIGVILIGNTLANIAAAALAALVGLQQGGNVGLALGVGLLTFVILIFGEVGPKTFAARHPERVAHVAAFLLAVLMPLMRPLVWIVNISANTLFRLDSIARGEQRLNSDELRALVQDVFIPRQHRSMLLGVLELDNITVDDIMVPRGEVQGLDIEEDIDTIVRQLRRTQHTRLPVFRGELNNCVGILHVRNSTRFLGNPELTKSELLQYVREPYFVPEGTTLPTQLVQFQKLKRRFALVVDEYGDVQGIVTLEAILEEIVGEFTTRIGDNHKDMVRQADGSWLIDGAATLRDINRLLSWQLPVSGPKTLNGLILETLETIPESALSLRIGEYCIEVLQIRDNAVRSARVIPPATLPAAR
ncbi:MAG: putative Mg2+ and Co2+ transporter CorB [Moraxellaceae bacterium]|nr:putative Mg2+ and Co2+ transporter CorB [Moraxellaceae bacterium]